MTRERKENTEMFCGMDEKKMEQTGVELRVSGPSVNGCFEPRLSIACLLRNVPRGPWGEDPPPGLR